MMSGSVHSFFAPGKETSPVNSSMEVVNALSLSDRELRAIADAARARNACGTYRGLSRKGTRKNMRNGAGPRITGNVRLIGMRRLASVGNHSAAGAGSRIQPLAFSKELLPVGSRVEGGVERPRAVSEYLVERMIAGGADKLCFVISRKDGHSGVLRLARVGGGYCLCGAIRAGRPVRRAVSRHSFNKREGNSGDRPSRHMWAPDDGFCHLPDDALSFLLFPVQHPELFEPLSPISTGR